MIDPKRLATTLARADRLVVLEDEFDDAPVLYETTDRRDIDPLLAVLRFSPLEAEFSVVLGCGEPVIDLYGDGARIARIYVYGGVDADISVRDTETEIVDVRAWLDWFDARGIRGPREEYEETLTRKRESEERYARWRAALSEDIRKAWAKVDPEEGEMKARVAFRAALSETLPDPRTRIQRLMELYGYESYGWFLIPSYEFHAGQLLDEFDVDTLVDALEPASAPPARLAGAARLFCGWRLDEARLPHLARLPPAYKAALWAQVKNDPDENKVAIARHYLGA